MRLRPDYSAIGRSAMDGFPADAALMRAVTRHIIKCIADVTRARDPPP